MKIVNNLKNPTVVFRKIKPGEVFMTLEGDIYMKVAQLYTRLGNTYASTEAVSYNCVCLDTHSITKVEDSKEVVPLDAELALNKNSYEKYPD